MSKLNKYYAWKHVFLIKYTKPTNNCFSSVYRLFCQCFPPPPQPSFTDGGLINLFKHPRTIPRHQSALQLLQNSWKTGHWNSFSKRAPVFLFLFFFWPREASVWHIMPNWKCSKGLCFLTWQQDPQTTPGTWVNCCAIVIKSGDKC